MARQDRTAYGGSRAQSLTRPPLFWRAPPSRIPPRRGACRGSPSRPAIPRTAPPLRVVTAPHPRRSHSATGIGGRSPRRNRRPPARSRFSTWHWVVAGIRRRVTAGPNTGFACPESLHLYFGGQLRGTQDGAVSPFRSGRNRDRAAVLASLLLACRRGAPGTPRI